MKKKPKPPKKPKMEIVSKCGARRGCIVTELPYMKAA